MLPPLPQQGGQARSERIPNHALTSAPVVLSWWSKIVTAVVRDPGRLAVSLTVAYRWRREGRGCRRGCCFVIHAFVRPCSQRCI